MVLDPVAFGFCAGRRGCMWAWVRVPKSPQGRVRYGVGPVRVPKSPQGRVRYGADPVRVPKSPQGRVRYGADPVRVPKSPQGRVRYGADPVRVPKSPQGRVRYGVGPGTCTEVSPGPGSAQIRPHNRRHVRLARERLFVNIYW
ncbi:hypothetical protein GCM10027572_22090 [Flexivirga lutea]